MSSNNIYNNIKESKNTPYFYIIKHKPTKKLYAGSRYAKGCNPNEFMQPDGYQTSSKTIHKLIERDGLNSFEILRIDTYCDGLHVYNYETLFLEVNNCASSSEWFNMHNNTKPPSFGTIEFKYILFKKYGNTKYINLNKMKETCLLRYGVDNIRKHQPTIDIIVAKTKETKLLRYGTLNPHIIYPGLADKVKNNNLAKYGYVSTSQIPGNRDGVSEKAKETKLLRYGNENYNNPDKYKETCLLKYGVENAMQNNIVQEKSKQTRISKNGGTYCKYETCIYCGKTSSKQQITAEHNDKCIKSPTYAGKTIYRCDVCNMEKPYKNLSSFLRKHNKNCKSRIR